MLKPKALPPQATSLKPQKPQILSPISGNNKKRKSIDLSQGCQRGATKIAKTEETSTKGKRIKVNDGENEVSSSSEPETKNVPVAIKENVPDAKQPKITGSLDRFLRTTQAREVSTTGAEDTVDLTDDNSKEATAEEKVQPDSSQDSREQDKEVAVSVEETSDKPTEATEDKATEKETSKPDNKVASDEKPEVEAKIKSPTAESEPKSTPATPKTPATRPPRKAVRTLLDTTCVCVCVCARVCVHVCVCTCVCVHYCRWIGGWHVHQSKNLPPTPAPAGRLRPSVVS